MQGSDTGSQELSKLLEKINQENAAVLHAVSHHVDKNIVSILSGLYKRAEQKELFKSFMQDELSQEDDTQAHP